MNNRGYIALLSVIIISFTLLTTVTTLNFFGAEIVELSLRREMKIASSIRVGDCVSIALARLGRREPPASLRGSYTVNSVVTCRILEALPSGGETLLHVEAKVGGSYTAREVKIRGGPPEIVSDREVAHF